MYIVKCYCHEDSDTPNLVMPYKTKKGAERRKNISINSGCYVKVEIVEVDEFRFIY
jgi:hypothetical protein